MEMGIQYTKYAGPPMKNSSVNSIVSTIYRYIAKIHSIADLKGVIYISFVTPSPAEVGSDLTRYRLAGKREKHSFN